MSRVGHAQLIVLAKRCGERRQRIVETVCELKLITGQQLQRLFFTSGASLSADRRHATRELRWLTENKLLHRLERRVGGRESGSQAFIYCIGPVGRRAVEFWQGHGLQRSRSTWEPGAAFVDHVLAVTELYVKLHENEQLELLKWQSEPSCWRTHPGSVGEERWVKPDAFVIVGDQEFEHFWFIEIDRGTERLATLRRKFQAYADYAASGREQREHGLFPHVVWIAPSERRSLVLMDLATTFSAICEFVATTDEFAVQRISGVTR